MKKILLTSFILMYVVLSCNQKKQAETKYAEINLFAKEENYADAVNKGVQTDSIKKSIPRQTSTLIAGNNISIQYYSPGVKGRIIWGGLVPYDQVWVTGAHSATKISFTKDIKIGNSIVVAGTYAIFSIPGKDTWIFILNKNYRQHLADDYKQEEDILRINIRPQILQDTVQRLTYEINAHGEGTGSIQIAWEKTRLSIPFHVLTSATGKAGNMSGAGKKLVGIPTDAKRDPVCYMPVTAGITDTFTYRKKLYGFCSAECRRLFISDADHYVADLKE